ncbi:MAG: glycoside hydrolase family 25 protein [Hyphomicrobiaceae bacterium]
MRSIKIAILALAVMAACVPAARLAYPWIEPALFLHEVHGIDVSHHQGPIDWKAVANDDVAFAYIKATEGGDYVDPRFAENWPAAAEAGVPRGAYHFFTQCRTGEIQARNFIRTVPLDKGALPHVVDAEHMGPCRETAQISDVVAEMTVFLDRLEAHYGRRPIIYTTREFHDAYLNGYFAEERFWVRSLVLPPGFRDRQWSIWQYHNRGRRAGITGPVDLNVLREGISALLARPL